MKRSRLAVLALVGACTTLLGPDAATDPQSLYDDLWREFDRRYAYFEHKNVHWKAQGDALRPLPDATAEQLFASMSSLLRALDDPHVALRTPFGTYHSGVNRSQRRTFYSQATALTYVSKEQLTASGRIRSGHITPSVGYVRIASFGGEGWGGEIDDALEALGDVKAIIIDARDNGGGNNDNGRAIANRFADERRIAGFFRYRNGPKHGDFTPAEPIEINPTANRFTGPVAVLCNRRCASASEDFLLRMRAIPDVVMVGDTSMGAVGNPIQRELANGWNYQLSEWMMLTPQMDQIEDVGLVPNIVVPATLADSTASFDRALERALAELNVRLSASARRSATPP